MSSFCLIIFEHAHFWKSGLNGAEWQHETYCVCIVDNKVPEAMIRKNVPKTTHVEKVILDELENNQEQPASLTLYLSYSPCNLKDFWCCKEILQYKRNHPECQIKIIFPKLYFIKRNENNMNKRGLISLLNKQGITLEPFNWEHWKKLIAILNDKAKNKINYTEEEYKASREQQDQELLEHLEDIKREGNFFLLSFTLYCFTFGYFNRLNSFLLDIKQPGIQAMYDLGFKYFLTERCKPIQWYDHDTLPEIH